MEQVAEALKALQSNGLWKAGVVTVIANIVDEIEEKTPLSIDDEQVLATLNAIISIYGTKSSATQWHDHDSEFDPNQKYDWEHDITGELYKSSAIVDDLYPQYANKWADGVYGGYFFDSNGTKFRTLSGVRGMGYKAIVAFDRNGRGIVFF